jgi:oligosaccharyltransferase complex subunit beta
MLNPYVRTNLSPSSNGTFTVQFKIPDVYGIYKFRVQYRRPGLTVLSLNDQVSIRPYRHNEYERFIGAAFPYYISALSIAVGFFVFAFVFLFSK